MTDDEHRAVQPGNPAEHGQYRAYLRRDGRKGATLHLIEPLGFSLSDKYLKRAGLDYWNLMTYHTYPDFGEFLRSIRMQGCTLRAQRRRAVSRGDVSRW